MSFGELPPPRRLWKSSGQFYLSGSVPAASELAKDGWQILSTVNITDTQGNIVGSMGAAQWLEDTGTRGVQVRDRDGGSVTFANGKVYVGNVPPDVVNSNKGAKVLVGGNVVSIAPTVNVNYKFQPIDPHQCNGIGIRGQIPLKLTKVKGDKHSCAAGLESEVASQLEFQLFSTNDDATPLYYKPNKNGDVKIVQSIIHHFWSSNPDVKCISIDDGCNIVGDHTTFTVKVTPLDSFCSPLTEDVPAQTIKNGNFIPDAEEGNMYYYPRCWCPANLNSAPCLLNSDGDNPCFS